MLAKEIRADAIEVFGRCDDAKLLDKVSSAVEMLRNESIWDATLGMMDIRSERDSHYITLPRDVETPLDMQLDGIPAIPRNRWFQFHLNGPGAYSRPDAFKRFWDDMGDVPTIFDPSYLFSLEVEFENPDDADKVVTVSGYNSAQLETTAENSAFDDVTWRRIIRVVKDVTVGMVYMYAVNVDDPSQREMIGLYYPDEEEISYRRIRVPSCTCIRMIYRRNYRGITSWHDYIPLNSKYALKNAFQAIKAIDAGDLAKGNAYQIMAVNFANKEQKQRNPRALNLVQVNTFGRGNNQRLWGVRGRFTDRRGW